MILFAVILIFAFLGYVPLLLNLAILVAMFFVIKKDLRDTSNHKYYLFSLLLTAIFFILSTSATKNFITLTEEILFSIVTLAVLAVYVFAYLLIFLHKGYLYLKKKYTK